MPLSIKLKKFTTASDIPTTSEIADGETAVNTTDKKIYTRVGSDIIEVANASSDGTFTIVDDSSSTVTLNLDTDSLTFTGGEGIDTSISGDVLTIAAEDASTSNKGVASFSSDNFAVSSGAVTIKNGGVANAELANSTVSFGGVELSLGGSDSTPAFDLSDGTNYPTSSLSGTITNAQLAGSIANAKLANSSINFGGVTLALGASDTTPAFNLSDATDYPTSSLTGTITNAQLAGSIANSKLSNSGFTLVDDSSTSTTISLGETLKIQGTSNEVDTSVSGDTITIGLPNNVTIAGNLTVSGTTTTIDTTNTVVSDKLLELANGVTGTPSGDTGIVIERGDSNNAFIGFDESADKFIVGTGTFTGASTGDLSITTGTLVANLEATTATLGGSDIISTDNTKTLTNKTINSASNTITITESNISDLGSYLENVSEDTSPQLGGNLDLNSNNITGTGNISTTGTLSLTTTTTGDSFLITTTENSSSAAPVVTLKRNSSSPADADYLGQIKFKGENDNDQEVNYAKITGKIDDASDGNERGLIEIAMITGGSQEIVARFKHDGLFLNTGNTLRFEGDGADAHELTLKAADSLDADRTATLPNATGTIALEGTVTSGSTSITSNLGSRTFETESLDTPVGFITISIGGTNYKLPYYSV